jgi:hypothetical protein
MPNVVYYLTKGTSSIATDADEAAEGFVYKVVGGYLLGGVASPNCRT